MARIEHFAVFADNLEALKDFYIDAFGMRVVLDNSKAATAGYFLADDAGVAFEIIQRPAGAAGSGTSQRYICHTAFLVDDVETARKALEARGLTFETDTVVDTPTFKTAFFNDPEGNRCQVAWRAKPLVGG
jgi:glyoxylase I family protein